MIKIFAFFLLISSHAWGQKPCMGNISPSGENLSNFVTEDLLPETLKCSQEERNKEYNDQLKKEQSEYNKNKKNDIVDWTSSNESPGENDKTNIQFKINGRHEDLTVLKKLVGSNINNCHIEKLNKCTDVMCALTQLLGDKLTAYRVLNFHYRTKSYLKIKTPAFSFKCNDLNLQREIKIVKKVVDYLPRSLFPLPHLKSLYLSPETMFHEKVSGRADKYYNIKLFSILTIGRINSGDISLENLSKQNLNNAFEDTTVHELGHHVDFALGSLQKTFSNSEIDKEFLNHSEWSFYQQKNEWGFNKDNSCFMSEYSQTNPIEDFAEHFRFYVTQPDKLKSFCPKKYQYMRNKIFRGKEFDSNRITEAEMINLAWNECKDTLFANQLEISDNCFFKLVRLEIVKYQRLDCADRDIQSSQLKERYRDILANTHWMIHKTLPSMINITTNLFKPSGECFEKNSTTPNLDCIKEKIYLHTPDYQKIDKDKFDIIFNKANETTKQWNVSPENKF